MQVSAGHIKNSVAPGCHTANPHTKNNDHQIAESKKAGRGIGVVAEAGRPDQGVGGLDMAVLGRRPGGSRLGRARGKLLFLFLLLLMEDLLLVDAVGGSRGRGGATSGRRAW